MGITCTHMSERTMKSQCLLTLQGLQFRHMLDWKGGEGRGGEGRGRDGNQRIN